MRRGCEVEIGDADDGGQGDIKESCLGPIFAGFRHQAIDRKIGR